MSIRPWFAWFPADYRAKTAHLDFIQDSAYRRMIDAYYERRGPLPCEPQALYRICSARTPDECKAIDYVAKEFFKNGDGVLHHERCDEQIKKEGDLHRAAVESGRKGGLRRAQGWLKEASSIPHPHPHPHPHPSSEKSQKDNLCRIALEILTFLNEKTGRRYRPVKANLDMIVARLKDGATEVELRQVIAKKAREWIGDEKMALYLRPATLFNRTKFAQYQGELIATGDK